MRCSLEKLFIIVSPTFVDLQRFIVDLEICREGSSSAEKKDHSFTLHFCELHEMSLQNPKNLMLSN